MAQAVGGLTKGIGSAFRTVVIIYAIAIGFTLLLLFISEIFTGIFPAVLNPFPLIYNSVRNITLFLLVFPPAFALVVAAWFLDLVLPILFSFLNGIFEIIGLPVDLPEVFDPSLVSTAEDLVGTIEDLVTTLFPPL